MINVGDRAGSKASNALHALNYENQVASMEIAFPPRFLLGC